jgi:hypothetical protein
MKVTNMTNKRVKWISSDLYTFAFQLLDADLEYDGDEAGRIATAVQRTFERNVSWPNPEGRAEELVRNADYEIECLAEDTSIVGNAMASGDDDFDAKCEQSIIDDLEDGNEWSWCTVRVTCTVRGYGSVGTDYLGCCSYDGEEAFKAGGYYDDMKGEARARLVTALSLELA